MEETLLVSLDEKGAPTVEVRTSTRVPSDRRDSREVVSLVETTRERLLRGEDAFALALRRVTPSRESVTFEWEDGELRRTTRRARLAGGPELEGFLRGAGLSGSLTRRDDVLWLELFPAPSNRATAPQRQRVDETIHRFAGAYADYLKAAAAFLRRVDRQPRRARALFARVLSRDEGRAPETGELDAEEESLAADLEDRIGAVGDVLSTGGGEGLPASEELRLVLDPFPADVRVRAEGSVLEAEGFERAPDGSWSVPNADLLEAAGGQGRSAEGRGFADRWVSPDLLAVFLEEARRPEPADGTKSVPPDAAQIAARPRRVRELPDASSVEKLLREALEPRDAYRLRVRVKPGE